jgi:hypothetical protein
LQSRGIKGFEIQQQLGLDSKLLLLAIEKLLDAGLIDRRSQKWQARHLSQFFNIKKLIAVEGKMSNWTDVFI